MKGYVIVDVSITDPVEYDAYRKLTPAAVEAYGGKFIVRGGQTVSLEGDWQPERVVVLEFPSVAIAQEWWSSAQYTEAKVIRQRSSITKMLIVEGV